MPDWLFHWTHDQVFIDILKAFIAALGPIAAGVITWFGIRWTGNLTKQTLENTKESTPPELLRLEKWSSILKDSNDYPENIKHELDINTIQSTYNDTLKRATLENRVINLGILLSNVRNELISANKIGIGSSDYPRPRWGGPKPNLEKWNNIIFGVVFTYMVVIGIFWPFGTIIYYGRVNFTNIIIIILYLLIIFTLLVFLRNSIGKNGKTSRENNIIFRNGYHALKDVYLIRKYEGIQETPKENKEREDFEKTKEYKEWWDKVKEDHPEWTSWNYGLSISWDNNPDKVKTDESEPESPTLIQKLSRTKLFFKRA